MSYNLRAYWEGENHEGVTDRLEIKELNYSGSTLNLTKTQGFNFSHQEITADNNNGYLNPTYNKILMGVLDFYVWGYDTDTKTLIEDIKSSESKQFIIEWKNNNNAMWFGFASGRIISKPEKDTYLSTIQFRDFEVLKKQLYTQDDTRQKVIQTIADIISDLGHNISAYSGAVLQTFTSWQAQGTDGDDDFLNQVYHDTIQLREYGRLGEENDTSITLYDALKYVCAPQLLIYQMYGAFNVVQLSAFEDPENVLRSDYYLNGTQVNSSLQDLTQETYLSATLGTPIIVQDTENTSYPSIQKVGVEYDHKSLNANINVPDSVTITTPSEQKYTMAVRLTGDESIIFSAKNISRVTVPYNLLTTFDENDVSTLNDEITIDQTLARDEKVRFKNTAGSLPDGIAENVTYYAKPIISDTYSFATLPYTLDYIDLTTTGDPSSVTQVLTIEEVTIKTAEYAVTLGNTFYDDGVNKFISPGLAYAGMNSILKNFGIADVDTVANDIEITSHGLKDGHLVIFTNTGGSLPGGIDADTYYYIINSTTNTFQISASYGGSAISLTSTGSGNHTINRATVLKNLSNTSSLAEYVGDVSFDLDDLITNQTVELNLHLFPTRTLQVGEMDNEYLDETIWEDTIVQFVDPSNTSSTSIRYELSQDDDSGAEILELPTIRYGDGPFPYSRSAYRTSTDLEDITTGWRRRGQSTYVDFHELLLKEVMDTQRGRPSKLNANVIGSYNPRTVLEYDSKNYAYVGGVYNARWYPTLVEINIQEGTDTLVEIKRVDPSGAGGVIATNPETEGLTESEADSRYLQITNDLSDVDDAETARDNLGLEIGADVQAWDAGLDDISGLTPTDGNIIVGNGANWVAESGDTARLSLGVGSTDAVTFSTVNTGQGDNELYAMDQPVQTTDDVQFDDITATGIIYVDNIDTEGITWNVSTQVWDATPSEYFNNPVFIGTSLDVDNALLVDDFVEVGTDLDVGGNTTLGGTLNVSGNATLGGTADISSNTTIGGTLSVSGNSILSGSLTLSGSADFNSTMNLQGNLTTQADLADDGFSEGWAGTNWKINADGSAEFEEMRIRGALRVYEFIAKQISTIGGSEILSIAQGRVSSVNVGTETITVENVTGTAGNAFKANDLWICQVVDINNDLESGGSGSIVKSVRGTVTSVSGNDIVVTIDAGDITQLEQGDLIIAYGNTSDADRQAIMYRNVDRSEDNLIMRLQTGVNDFSKLQAEANTRVAFGDLNGYSGLNSETFGFFAGDNSGGHILATSSGLFLKDGSTTLAELTNNTFKVGGGTKYIEFDGTDLDVQSENYKLTAGELVIDSSLDKKIVVSNATEEIIAIGDFDFGAEVEDTSSSTATSSSTTNTKTNATATNSATNMDSGFGTYTSASSTAVNSNFITLRRDYNNTRGKWIRVEFDYSAPAANNEAIGDLAIGFTINYFGKTIEQLNRSQDDTNAISGSVDEYLFIPDNASYSYIQVFALAPAGTAADPTGGLDNVAPDVHGRINLTNLAVTEISNTYTYTDIGNDGFRVYNSGGRNKLDFSDGKAEGTFETLSIGSWDFVLDADGNLELQYDGTLVQQFTRPT